MMASMTHSYTGGIHSKECSQELFICTDILRHPTKNRPGAVVGAMMPVEEGGTARVRPLFLRDRCSDSTKVTTGKKR